MPKESKYRKLKITKLKKEALMLYKQGWSLRQVGKAMGRSHEWVRLAISELSTPEDSKDLTPFDRGV